MVISEVIQILKEFQEEYGDLEVYHGYEGVSSLLDSNDGIVFCESFTNNTHKTPIVFPDRIEIGHQG